MGGSFDRRPEQIAVKSKIINGYVSTHPDEVTTLLDDMYKRVTPDRTRTAGASAEAPRRTSDALATATQQYLDETRRNVSLERALNT